MTRSWSLGRRLAIGFGGWSSVMIAAMATLGIVFVERTAQRELDELVEEELAELEEFLTTTNLSPAAFADVTRRLASAHPTFGMAWRVVYAESNERWGEFGDIGLLTEATPPEIGPGEEAVFAHGLRWANAPVAKSEPPLVVGFVLDGRSQLEAAARLETAVLVFAAAAALLSCLVAGLLGSRVSRLLIRVAKRAGELEPGEPDPLDEGDPEEIQQVTEALATRLASVRTQEERTRWMATGIAHDLRTPLQNLVGSTEVAFLRDRDPEEYRALLRDHLGDLRELTMAIDNLVVLCAGPQEGNGREERFDLSGEIDLRLRGIPERLGRPDVVVETTMPASTPVRGDREALLLALRNVVANAVQWSPKGGAVTVDVERLPDRVSIRVADSGPGIPAEEREVLFEPFRRGDSSRDTGLRHGGYGLGLALARRAFEVEGGSVTIDDGPRGGACFRLELPVDLALDGADGQGQPAGE